MLARNSGAISCPKEIPVAEQVYISKIPLEITQGDRICGYPQLNITYSIPGNN